MKNTLKIFFGIMVILLTGTGCKKWLDVNPSNQVSADELFKTADGFHIALNGIYEMLASQNLYGCQLTWGIPSALGQDYEPYYCGDHNAFLMLDLTDINTNAPAIITNVWTSAFHTIANCNKLIQSVSAKDSSFFPLGNAEKGMILGEATAARALLHFDMLRLFAPAPIQNSTAKLIPYVDTYPDYVPAHLSTSEVLSKIIADLQTAQALVAPMDTIVNRNALAAKNGTAVMPVGGIHFNFRRNRLNYVGIHGLLARVYLYANDVDSAKKEAGYVYDNYGPSGRLDWWDFNPESDFTTTGNMDNIMSNDLIISFYDKDLDAHVRATRGSNSYNYALSPADVPNWYPSTERDYRTYLIKADGSREKWLSDATAAPGTLIPILRMSEMYYIYSECLWREGNQADALKVLNEVRIARGATDYFYANNDTDFYNELLGEYRREFITEGQTFYAYKRLNMDIMTAYTDIPMDSHVILPIPNGETSY